MKYNLIIKPAIRIDDRHQIEQTLVRLGYDIIGGGTMMDGSSSDISFEFSDYWKRPRQLRKEGE
jgi:hypothetical protein